MNCCSLHAFTLEAKCKCMCTGWFTIISWVLVLNNISIKISESMLCMKLIIIPDRSQKCCCCCCHIIKNIYCFPKENKIRANILPLG